MVQEKYIEVGGEKEENIVFLSYELAKAMGREEEDDRARARYSEIGLSRVGCHSPL